MYISNLDIQEFRLFENNNFKIGKYITAIAGFNTAGKSTILGLLGNCGKLGKQYKSLLNSNFKTELSEIIKFSPPFDGTISNVGTITFEGVLEENSDYPKFLSGPQDKRIVMVRGIGLFLNLQKLARQLTKLLGQLFIWDLDDYILLGNPYW